MADETQRTRTRRRSVRRPTPTAAPRLVRFHGGGTVAKPLDTPSLTLGRNDPLLDDPSVSRLHAKVLSDDDGVVTIIDLESKNGTYVNGVRVDLRVLKEGDHVQLGDVELTFTRHGEEGSHAPRNGLDALAALTKRELEVAQLVAAGLTNARIAEELGIKLRTVTSHLDHIYDRLGINSRAALARLAGERGAREGHGT